MERDNILQLFKSFINQKMQHTVFYAVISSGIVDFGIKNDIFSPSKTLKIQKKLTELI